MTSVQSVFKFSSTNTYSKNSIVNARGVMRKGVSCACARKLQGVGGLVKKSVGLSDGFKIPECVRGDSVCIRGQQQVAGPQCKSLADS